MDNTSRKNFKTQSISFGIEILILDSQKKFKIQISFLRWNKSLNFNKIFRIEMSIFKFKIEMSIFRLN